MCGNEERSGAKTGLRRWWDRSGEQSFFFYWDADQPDIHRVCIRQRQKYIKDSNDTPQHCISSLDDEGIIQQNYFNGEGATINYYDPDDETDVARPSIHALELLEDGSLLVGGAFSDFMGVERYSMVKLNQGTVSTRDQDRLEGKVKVYPNPANEYVQLEYELLFAKRNTVMNVYDQVGRKVNSYTIGTNTKGVEILDTRKLVSGLYIVEIVQEGQHVSSEKFIVQH